MPAPNTEFLTVPATGTKIRILTVVDTFSRYVPVLDPQFSYRAENVVRANA